MLQRRIERRGFAGTGRSGHEDDAVRASRHAVPARLVIFSETEFRKAAHEHFRIEDPHHQFLAERSRQRRETQFRFLPVRCTGLDAPVLRPPFLDQIHTPENLDAADHRRHHAHRNLIHLMQHTVNAEAHDAEFAARLDVDIAGALLEGILPEPVHDIDDVLVVGIELLVGSPQFNQLFERRQASTLTTLLRCFLDRAREVVKLYEVARHIDRAGQHTTNPPLDDRLDLALPITQERFRRCNHHLIGRHLHRQNPEPGGIGAGHYFGDSREIDLQRVDVVVIEAYLRGKPLAEIIQRQWPVGSTPRFPFLVCHHHQRVGLQLLQAGLGNQRIRIRLFHQTVRYQHPEEFRDGQTMVRRR